MLYRHNGYSLQIISYTQVDRVNFCLNYAGKPLSIHLISGLITPALDPSRVLDPTVYFQWKEKTLADLFVNGVWTLDQRLYSFSALKGLHLISFTDTCTVFVLLQVKCTPNHLLYLTNNNFEKFYKYETHFH